MTAAEKAQAREVSLRRIGQLFIPYRWPLAIVTAIIVASSIVGLASPFLLRAVIDTALPDQERAAAGLAGHRHGGRGRPHLGPRA